MHPWAEVRGLARPNRDEMFFKRRSPTILVLALVAGMDAAAHFAHAQTTKPAQPPPAGLQALDRDVQKLFGSAEGGLVRVTVPVRIPTKLFEQEHPLAKGPPLLAPKLRAPPQTA